MQEITSPAFSPLTSKHSVALTWLFNIFGGSMLVGLFFILAGLPFFVSKRVEVWVVIGLVYYPLYAFALFRFVCYIISKMAHAIRTIRVDDQGIHFENKKGDTTEILYRQLGPSYHSKQCDVYLMPINKTYRLAINLEGIETTLVFDGTDVGSVYTIQNGRALRAKFIEGIVYFRPDLSIDSAVFKEFSIHPQYFTFDRKQYGQHIVKGVLILLCILLLSCFLALILTLF